MNQNDLKRDKYLQKKYGVTLDWYNQKLAEQGNGCAICGSKPVTRSLPVDHDHKIVNQKFTLTKLVDYLGKLDVWQATGLISGDLGKWNGRNKKEVRKVIKTVLKHKSTRGVICFGCNTGIRKFRDKPELLEAAAAYLRKYQESLNAK